MRRKVSLIVAGLCVAFVAAIAGAAGAFADNPEPPSPPWVGADGRVDPDQAPATVPVVGPNGEILTDFLGLELEVAFASPPEEPAQIISRSFTVNPDGSIAEEVETAPQNPVP